MSSSSSCCLITFSPFAMCFELTIFISIFFFFFHLFHILRFTLSAHLRPTTTTSRLIHYTHNIHNMGSSLRSLRYLIRMNFIFSNHFYVSIISQSMVWVELHWTLNSLLLCQSINMTSSFIDSWKLLHDQINWLLSSHVVSSDTELWITLWMTRSIEFSIFQCACTFFDSHRCCHCRFGSTSFHNTHLIKTRNFILTVEWRASKQFSISSIQRESWLVKLFRLLRICTNFAWISYLHFMN